MEPKVFAKFQKIVYEQSGIALRDGKEALVCARVGKRMRALGMDDYRKYLRYVKADETGGEVVQLLDAISTNVTSFFREPDHFTFMREHLTRWHEEGQTRFRLWSAACSSGEEPYTMAMTMAEALPKSGVDAKILATDINTDVLQRSMAGLYRESKMKGVSLEDREKHFARKQDGEEIVYAVRPELQRRVVFRRLNLSRPPFPMRGPLDMVMCRNVMIYFDNDVRKRLLDEIYRLLKPGGYLMVGHAESLTGMMSDLKTVRPSIYVRA